jgi:hypothetical protein
MPPGVVFVLVSEIVTVPPPLNKPTCVDVCGGTLPEPPVQRVVFHGTDDPVLSVMYDWPRATSATSTHASAAASAILGKKNFWTTWKLIISPRG